MQPRISPASPHRRVRPTLFAAALALLLTATSAHAQTTLKARTMGDPLVVVFKDTATDPVFDQTIFQRMQQQFTGTEWSFTVGSEGVGGLTISRGGQALFARHALLLAGSTQLVNFLFHYGDATQVINGEVFRNPANLKEGYTTFYITLLPTASGSGGSSGGGGFGGGFGGGSGSGGITASGGLATSAYVRVLLEFE